MPSDTLTSLPAPELYPVPLEPRSRRLESLDMLRGLLMILMALDHTRDFFSNSQLNPTDPHESYPVLYLTRWVTHLCAPGFVALAGCSVYLQRRRGKTVPELRRLLITRGLWLILLEFTVISFGWSFAFMPFLQVIWAVGLSMVGLGLLMGLPTWAIGAVGGSIALLHNLLDPIRAKSFGNFADVWVLVHQPGMLMLHGHPEGFVAYPALAWFGVICLGYAFGPVAASAPETRRRTAVGLAAGFAAVFSLLRLHNGYGDSIRFEHLETGTQTAMSFLNVQKYPPSLEYVLATFTVLLLLYAAFDLAASRDWARPVRRVPETLGRVPFFYYVPHIYLLHLLAIGGTLAMHSDPQFWFGLGVVSGGPRPAGWGFSLPVVYCVWVSVVAILYGPCLWFSRVKARRSDWWLSYL